MFDSLKSWLTRLQPEVTAPMHAPKHEPTCFELRFDKLEIGCLSLLEGGIWEFVYTDSFQQQQRIKPLIGFPDLHKVYRNEQLWPFFSSRIPSADQPYVQEKARCKQLDLTNTAEMLKEFGGRTITNPFALLAV
jgi:HipA-like protein